MKEGKGIIKAPEHENSKRKGGRKKGRKLEGRKEKGLDGRRPFSRNVKVEKTAGPSATDQRLSYGVDFTRLGWVRVPIPPLKNNLLLLSRFDLVYPRDGSTIFPLLFA